MSAQTRKKKTKWVNKTKKLRLRPLSRPPRKNSKTHKRKKNENKEGILNRRSSSSNNATAESHAVAAHTNTKNKTIPTWIMNSISLGAEQKAAQRQEAAWAANAKEIMMSALLDIQNAIRNKDFDAVKNHKSRFNYAVDTLKKLNKVVTTNAWMQHIPRKDLNNPAKLKKLSQLFNKNVKKNPYIWSSYPYKGEEEERKQKLFNSYFSRDFSKR